MSSAYRIVTGVQRLPAKEAYAVYIDGEHAFDLDAEVYFRVGLREGDVLDEERLAHVQEEVALSRAKSRALRLLSAKARSEADLTRRLRELGIEPGVVDQVVDWLRELGYLDDEAFARQWVRSRASSKKMGARRLALELCRKGIPTEIAKEAVKGVTEADEEVWAYQLASKEMSRLGKLPREKAMRRVYGLLERRGFGHDVVYRVVSRLFP